MELWRRRQMAIDIKCTLQEAEKKIEELREVISKIETYGLNLSLATRELQKFICRIKKEQLNKETKSFVLNIANNLLVEIKTAKNTTNLNNFATRSSA